MKTSITSIFTSPKGSSSTSMSLKFPCKNSSVSSILTANISPRHDIEEEGGLFAPNDDLNEDYIPCTPPTTPPKDAADTICPSSTSANRKPNKLEELKVKTLEAKNQWIEKKNQWEAKIEAKKQLTTSNWLEFETKLKAKQQNWQEKVKETHTNLKIKTKQIDDLFSKIQMETILFKPADHQQEQQQQEQTQDQEPYVQETTFQKFLTTREKEDEVDDTNQTESEEEEEQQQEDSVEEYSELNE